MDYSIFCRQITQNLQFQSFAKPATTSNLTTQNSSMPAFHQRNTTIKIRINHLAKEISKKIKLLKNLYNHQTITNQDNTSNKIEEIITTYLSGYKDTCFNEQSTILHALEFYNKILNVALTKQDKLNDQIIKFITYTPIKPVNSIPYKPFKTFQINLSKTTLYSSPYAIGLNYINKHQLPIPNILDILLFLANLIHIPILTLQFSNYLQLGQLFWHNKTEFPFPIPLYVFDAYLTVFNILQTQIPPIFAPQARFINILPTYYKKPIKRFFIAKASVLGLSRFMNSNKRAKKYLRILNKRLGFYTQKKPAWI